MNKKQIKAELAKLKIQFGNGLFPVEHSAGITKEDLDWICLRAELATKGYVEFAYESIEDDEGISHNFKRGYKFTQKAKDLLEEV